MQKERKKNLNKKIKLIETIEGFLKDCEIEGSDAISMANCLNYLDSLKKSVRKVIKSEKS